MSNRKSAGRRGKERPSLTYSAQIANYITALKFKGKELVTTKEITECALDRKTWKELIDGIESPEPNITSVLDAPDKPAR